MIFLVFLMYFKSNIIWEKQFNFLAQYIRADDDIIVFGLDKVDNTGGHPRIIRINTYGNILFEKTYEHIRLSTLSTRKISNGIALVGLVGTPGDDTSPYLIIIDEQGCIIYEELFDLGHSDIVDIKVFNGEIFIIGNVYSGGYHAGNGGCSLYWININIAAKSSLVKHYRINEYTSGGFINKTIENNYLIFGQTRTDNIGLYKIELDRNGQLIGEEIFGTTHDDNIQSVRKIKGRGFIISAISYNFDNKNYQCFLTFFNEMGDKVWEKGFLNKANFGIKYLTEDNEGFIFSAYYSNYPTSGMSLLKVDWNGNIIWHKDFDALIEDIVYSQNLPDGIFIAGNMLKNDIPYLIEIGSNGERRTMLALKHLSNITINNYLPIIDRRYLVGGYTKSSNKYKLIMSRQ